MKSTASLDKTAKVITTLYFGLTAFAAALAIRNYRLGESGEMAEDVIMTAFLTLLALIVWLFAPRYYSFNREQLSVHRPAGKVSIPITQISTVDEVPREALRGMLRTFGVGGLFGYYGMYWMPGIGSVQMYATRAKNMILITTTTGKKFIVSPDDELFAARLRAML